MLAQPRQQGPAGRIGQGREGAIQRRWLILNHVVKYRMRDACCQVRISVVIPGRPISGLPEIGIQNAQVG